MKTLSQFPVIATNALSFIGADLGPNPGMLRMNQLTLNCPEDAFLTFDEMLESSIPTNVIFGNPHPGPFVPNSFFSRMQVGAHELMALVDRGCWDIFQSEIIPSIAFLLSRFICDPNRNAQGGGDTPGEVLWKKCAFSPEGQMDPNRSVYQFGHIPSDDEIKFIVQFHQAYFTAMHNLINRIAEPRSGERILVIDGHSFPVSKNLKAYWQSPKYASEFAKFDNDPTKLPLFIIGDKDGIGCDSDILQAFVTTLEQKFNALNKVFRDEITRGWNGKQLVGVNTLLKGVHNIDEYRDKVRGINVFQLETNDTLYYDEIGDEYFSGGYKDAEIIGVVRKLIENTCLEVSTKVLRRIG